MLIAQSSVAMGAVFMCLLFYRSLGLVSQVQPEHTLPVGSLLRRIWSFSLMQIAGIVSMNIGGWWLTTLIAKGDTTMKQVGYFAVAHQLRNMVALMPSLIIEGSFAEMTESADGRQRSPDQVTAICTYVATLVTVVLAGFGMIVVPWVLPLIYGRAYASASPAAAIALATAVIHMGSGAAAFRVSVLSIRTSIVVNTTWALVVGGAATLFLLRGGGAATGAAVYLGAHVVTSILVLGFLRRRGNAPRGMISAFSIGALCIIALAGLSLLRSSTGPARFAVPAVMAVIWAAGAATLIGIGKRRRWLPTKSIIMRMRDKVFGALRPKLS
jgi:O-antigen/teichoic acid export membrane protein